MEGYLKEIVRKTALFAWICIIFQKIQLVEGTPVYEHWLHPVLPTTTNLYLFSLENHDEFMAAGTAAAKPLIRQKGPYVFKESVERANVVHHPHNSSVTYQTRRFWNFVPDLSAGSLDDNVTTINFPVMVRLCSL